MLTDKFKREPRYIVFKAKDALAHLSACQLDRLQEIGETVATGRSADGKPQLECVVVESGWPEYEPTWAAIEARMTGSTIEAEVRAEAQKPAKFLFLACTDNGEVIPTLCANERAVFRLVMSEMFSDPTEATDEGAEHAEYVARELIAEGAVSFEGDPGLLLYKLPDGFTTRAAPQPPAKQEAQEPVATADIIQFGNQIIKCRQFLPIGTKLYTAPQPPAPCPAPFMTYREERDALQAKVDELTEESEYYRVNRDISGYAYLDMLHQRDELVGKVAELEQAFKDKDDAATQLVTAMQDMAGKIKEQSAEIERLRGDFNRDTVGQIISALQSSNTQKEGRIAELEQEVSDHEGERDDVEHQPWPEWAEQCLKIVREYSGYDGFDDNDGVDLPTELSEQLSEMANADERQRSRITALEHQLSAGQDTTVRLERVIRELESHEVAPGFMEVVRLTDKVAEQAALIEKCERFITAAEDEFPVSSKPILDAIAAQKQWPAIAKDAP